VLLAAIASALGRSDVVIRPVASGRPTDRTLVTVDPARNVALWAARVTPRRRVSPKCWNELAAHAFRLDGLAA